SRTTMELVQTHALCRTQTPSATSVSISSPFSGIDPEEFRESLKQFQVALQDGDHVFLHGLGRGQSAGDQMADVGADGEPQLRLAVGQRASHRRRRGSDLDDVQLAIADLGAQLNGTNLDLKIQ